MSKLLTTLILLTIFKIVNAQEFEPLELVQNVFTNKEFAKEISNYATGEYKGHPNANDLPININLNFRLLNKSEYTAVVNITMLDSSKKGIDTYVHLKKGEKWKINAFRALAMTAFMKQSMVKMEEMTEEQIDTLIRKGETFTSKKHFYRELENIKLTLALDDIIIKHFEKNKEKFEELKNKLQNIVLNKKEESYQKMNLGNKVKADYRKLLINSISKSIDCKNCFEFIIGGMIDNTVGFFYISNEQNVPKMNTNRIIMIREIGNGWYLFKTT